MAYLFVGERPSLQAAKIGATWQNGKLAAKQLHDALRAAGIDPAKQRYVNLWRTPGTGPINEYVEASALMEIAGAVAEGYTVVGMGHLVCRALTEHKIGHLFLKKERYAAHVSSALEVA